MLPESWILEDVYGLPVTDQCRHAIYSIALE